MLEPSPPLRLSQNQTRRLNSGYCAATHPFDSTGHGGFFASTGSGYNNPFGLAYANGNLYATCNVNQLEVFSATGNAGFFASTLNGPWFIAVQPVPEPSVLALLAASTIVFYDCRNKKRLGE
jgi:hypothetical protein